MLMTQLDFVPAFEYIRRRVLGLLGGAGWQPQQTRDECTSG